MKTTKWHLLTLAVLLGTAACTAPSSGAITVKDSGWLYDKDISGDGHGDLGKIYWMEKGSKSYSARNITIDTGKTQYMLLYAICNDPDHLKPNEKYHTAGGMSSLGMNGSWYSGGFVDAAVNGSSLSKYKPEIDSQCQGDEASARYTWETPDARVTMLFTAKNGDDKMAMKVSFEPKSEIKSIKTGFVCYPSSYVLGSQAQSGKDRWIATSTRAAQNVNKITLTKDEYWILYYDTIWDRSKREDCGGPCALLYPPTEPENVELRINSHAIWTDFTYPVSIKEANYILWNSMGCPNTDALARMKALKKE